MTKPMRVAYLINQYPKVSHSFIRREIQALERQGLEIHRFALRGWDAALVDPDDEQERGKTRYVLRESKLALLAAVARQWKHPKKFADACMLAWRMSRRSDRPLFVHLAYLVEACCVLGWMRDVGAEHLHAHFGTNSAEVAMLAGVLGGPRWSFTVHGPEEFDKAPLLGLAEKAARAAFVVAISSYGRSQLYRLLPYSEWRKVKVVRCGLEPTFYGGPLLAPPAAPRLVCVGRLCEQKGQLLLIEAMHRLQLQGIRCDVVLVGDGEMRREIEDLVESLGLRSNVRITGWVGGAAVREEIRAARALVLPSFAEGLPVVLMEAMALGRPVVSTYVAGIPEVVQPGENGWLVPAGDVEALADAMNACLNAPLDRLALMGEAARARVSARHDVGREAGKLGSLLCFSIQGSGDEGFLRRGSWQCHPSAQVLEKR